MAPLSEDIWKEIKSNQVLPLMGSAIPAEGNGFHDTISWRVNFQNFRSENDELHSSWFHMVYLRDLSNYMNPSYTIQRSGSPSIEITNCTNHFSATLLRYFNSGNSSRSLDFLSEIGRWAKYLCHDGRLIFEIVGWYDNDSKQFYGFELLRLPSEFCQLKKNHVIFSAPKENNKIGEVKIPIEKCVIIEFPKELGGFKGYKKVEKKILKLGSRHGKSSDPTANMEYSKSWEQNFNKILIDWGNNNSADNTTEFYQTYTKLKFKHTSALCLHEVVEGFGKLVDFLNNKFKEKAKVEFEYTKFDLIQCKKKKNDWLKGKLSVKEAIDFYLK